MCKSSRRRIELLKSLLIDPTIDSEADRILRWRHRTGLSRPRYYVFLKLAMEELERERSIRRERSSTVLKEVQHVVRSEMQNDG